MGCDDDDEIGVRERSVLRALEDCGGVVIDSCDRLKDVRLEGHRGVIEAGRETMRVVTEVLGPLEEFRERMRARPLSKEIHLLALKLKAKHEAMTGTAERMIWTAISAEQVGRVAAAGMALFALRNWHLDRLPSEFEHGEGSWREYASKHLPFGYERAEELIGFVSYRGGSLRCSECGIEALCPCGCGASFLPEGVWVKDQEFRESEAEPTALERAMEALREHPERSNRALAREIHVDERTVRTARQKMRPAVANSALDSAPEIETRVGRDGKTYRRAKARPGGGSVIDELFPDGSPACDVDWEAVEPDGGAFQHRQAFRWQSLEGERLAVENALLREGARVNKTDIKVVRKVARHWIELAKALEARRKRRR